MKDLLSLNFLSKEEVLKALTLAEQYKKNSSQEKKILAHKNIGLLFLKNSTRTFISFQVGINQLGGNSIILDPKQLQMNRGETIEHTAKTFNSYLDALVVRCESDKFLNDLSKCCDIPIINALSDNFHPCQVMADLQTIFSYVSDFSEVSLAFLGDCSCNMANSFILASHKLGFKLKLIGHSDFNPKLLDIKKYPTVEFTDNLEKLDGCKFIYTDTWVSMGKEEETKSRLEKFKKFQLNQKLLEKISNKYYIMHCLPAHIGQEITKEVFNSKQSIIWEQTENRLHMQKALMDLKFR